jgi:hypothetical protein
MIPSIDLFRSIAMAGIFWQGFDLLRDGELKD